MKNHGISQSCIRRISLKKTVISLISLGAIICISRDLTSNICLSLDVRQVCTKTNADPKDSRATQSDSRESGDGLVNNNHANATLNGSIHTSVTKETNAERDTVTATAAHLPDEHRIPDSGRSDFLQVNDEERYIYSSFIDARFNTPYLRMFGMQDNTVASSVHCRFNYGNGTEVDVPPEVKYAIFPQWPSPKLKYLAHYYGCKIPDELTNSSLADIEVSAFVEGSRIQTRLSVTRLGKNQERKPLAVCVKAVWGPLDPYRLVEWIEANRKLGVDKFVMYDGTVTGPALRVLNYYSNRGIVELISFTYVLNMATLMMKDPMRSHMHSDDFLLEQGYLVSMNDCYYRLRDQYKYILLIDIDEILVPAGNISLISLIRRLEEEQPDASAYIFPVAWHFEEMKETTEGDADIPEYLHMQRHLRRTHVMNPSNDQPKAIINTDGAVTVNWHGVVTIPTNRGFNGNFNVDWKQNGFIHHFRRDCKIKYKDKECDFMMNMNEIDSNIPQLLSVKESVRHVLVQNNIL